MSILHSWPGTLSWDEIVATIRSWSDGPISRDEAYEVAQIAGLLGLFGFPKEEQTSGHQVQAVPVADDRGEASE